jgi:hypothetical protein
MLPGVRQVLLWWAWRPHRPAGRRRWRRRRTGPTLRRPAASSPCTSAAPKASPAPRPQTTRTGVGATVVIPSAVATSTPSAPFSTNATSTPAAGSRRAASSGSRVPTATSTSARLPTATVACSSSASYSRRAVSGLGQNIGRQSRSSTLQRPSALLGRRRCLSMAWCVARLGSTLIPVVDPDPADPQQSQRVTHGGHFCRKPVCQRGSRRPYSWSASLPARPPRRLRRRSRPNCSGRRPCRRRH